METSEKEAIVELSIEVDRLQLRNEKTNHDASQEHGICSICSEELAPEDKIFPLLCEGEKCHFNMCSECTANLLKSSKSGPQEASDGNMYQTKLKCPSCRSSFFVYLSDVILLRQVEVHERLQDTNDAELNAKDLRRKHNISNGNMSDMDIVMANERYENARKKSDGVFDELFDEDDDMSSIGLKPSDSDDFNREKPTSPRSLGPEDLVKQKIQFVDNMVLMGLEHCMTDAERNFIVEMMTSGSTTKLVNACQLLSSIIKMNAMKNRERQMKNANGSDDVSTRSNMSSSTSPTSSSYPRSPGVSSRKFYTSTSLSIVHKSPTQSEIDAKNHSKWGSLFPLPFRTPRHCSVTLNFDPYDPRSCPIKFIDDEESFPFLKYNQDYSELQEQNKYKVLCDAYSTISFNSWGQISVMDGSSFNGPKNILNQMEECGDVVSSDDVVLWRRVIVSYLERSAGRHTGLCVGDVITHIDGEPFDGNVEKLKFLMARKKSEELFGEEPTMDITVNAETSVAKVLMLRSFAVRKLTAEEELSNVK